MKRQGRTRQDAAGRAKANSIERIIRRSFDTRTQSRVETKLRELASPRQNSPLINHDLQRNRQGIPNNAPVMQIHMVNGALPTARSLDLPARCTPIVSRVMFEAIALQGAMLAMPRFTVHARRWNRGLVDTRP
jgi:hypothetical protein